MTASMLVVDELERAGADRLLVDQSSHVAVGLRACRHIPST